MQQTPQSTLEDPRLERLALLLDARSDYALIFLDEEGRIVEWPAGAVELLGWAADEVLGRPFDFIFTGDDQRQGAPAQELAVAERTGRATDDRWHVRKDGSMMPTVGRMVALRRSDGVLRGFAILMRDATEIHRLQESERKFREIFETAQEGIWILDESARIVMANQRMADLVGCSAQDLVGRQQTDFTLPEDEPRLRGLFEARRRGEVAASVEVRFRHSDGHTVRTLLSAGPIVRNRSFAGALDMFTDITEMEWHKRMAERTAELEAKTRQLEDFCYTVAHDLRAPLRSINGFASLAEEDLAEGRTAESAEYLVRIRNSTRRLDQLIQDLMTYTRVSTVAIERRPVDLALAVTTAVAELESEVQRLRGTVVCEGEFPAVVGERAMVEQVILNLLSNALKFATPGQAPHVRLRSQSAEGRVRTLVRDEGIGIAPEYHQRIFRVFERLDKNAGRLPGTGIGLAVVARAMERLGGTYGLDSTAGAGSTFWFELPAARP